MDQLSRAQFGRLKLRVRGWNPSQRFEYLCAITSSKIIFTNILKSHSFFNKPKTRTPCRVRKALQHKMERCLNVSFQYSFKRRQVFVQIKV